MKTKKGFYGEQESPNEAVLSPNEVVLKHHNPKLGGGKSLRQAMKEDKMAETHS